MASRKLEKRIATAERWEAQAKQLALRADAARKAIGVAKRKKRIAELCDIGGDALSVGLDRLSPAERLGAFMIIAEKMEDEEFLADCRRRSGAEMSRRQEAREANKEQKARKRPKPDAAQEMGSTPTATIAPVTEPAGSAQPAEPESLIVRFSGPIPGLGSRLRKLELSYDNKKIEWRGKAHRAAVEAEIAASPFSKLLIGIISVPRPAASTAVETHASPTATPAARSLRHWSDIDPNDIEIEN